MNLIEMSSKWVKYIEQLMRDRRSGKISQETFDNELKSIDQIGGFAQIMIKTRIVEEKYKKPIMLDYNELPNVEIELIECLGIEVYITRRKCLDFSGQEKFEECPGCKIGLQTKKLLLEKIK